MIASNNPSNGKPYNVVMEVGPKQAIHWLENNSRNRAVKQSHVDRLARDIIENRWRLSHQGIAFDTRGLLLDGQHRLWAIVEANRPVLLRVFFNEPAENKQVMDVGERRSNLDIMTMTQQVGDVSAKHLSTLRSMLAGRSVSSTRRSVGEEGKLFLKHGEAIRFAMRHLGASSIKGVSTAITRAVVARAFYSAPHNVLVHFCNILKSGIASNDEDYAAVMLWQFLVRESNAGRADGVRRLRYGKTEWALAAFLDGKTPKRLYGANAELFPLPEEMINLEMV